MDERERQALRIARDAVDFEGIEQNAFIQHSCENDPDLLAHVLRLLANAEQASTEYDSIISVPNLKDAPDGRLWFAREFVGADVYSLGVILYELIAGACAYPVERLDMPASERIVRELPIKSLLTAISRTDFEQVRLANRSMSTRACHATVRGDLFRIPEKTLAKEPERRYATVEAFVRDLQCWLKGAPVQISDNRYSYRLGKFITRNRVAVGIIRDELRRKHRSNTRANATFTAL